MRVAVILDTGPWYLNACRLWFEYCVHYFALTRPRDRDVLSRAVERLYLSAAPAFHAPPYGMMICAHEHFQALSLDAI